MKRYEVVDKILEYHPNIPNYSGCDDWKAGNGEGECTGVVTAMTPTIDVIKKTAELGANLLIVHEPTFYTSLDEAGWFEDFPNSVYDEKQKLLDETGISIWRDHDHLHCHQPDGIFAGVLKYMGWEATTVDTDTGAFAHWNVTLPEQSLGELMEHIKSTLNLNGLRYVGDADMRIKNMTLVGHLYPMPTGRKRSDGKPFEYSVGIIDKMEKWADVILPGEIIEWTVLSYVRDAIQLGKTKAVVNIGHYNWEELGMRYAKDWLTELLGDAVPVSYVPSGDMYRFI